jgi:hypothetical protein
MQPIEIAKLLCVLTYIFWCICLQTAKCDISYESNCTFVNGVVKLLSLCFACCPSQLIWVQTRALYAWYKHKFRKLGKTFDCRWHIHLNLGSVCGSPIVLVRYVDSLLALCSVNIWRKCFNSCLQQQQKLTTASRF